MVVSSSRGAASSYVSTCCNRSMNVNLSGIRPAKDVRSIMPRHSQGRALAKFLGDSTVVR
jgi:hypothetical protein